MKKGVFFVKNGERIEYVRHSDVELLNKYEFLEIYLKLLPLYYSLYNENLLGKSFEYRLSSQDNNILFTFDAQCCMHLLGLNFNEVRDLFIEYYDLLNLDLQDDFSKIENKTSCEMLEIIISNIDKIMEFVRYAEKSNSDFFDKIVSFINKFRKCLSDYSFEKMESIYALVNNIEDNKFKEFVVLNPSWQNVDCSICFNVENNIFSLGVIKDKYGLYHVSSIRRDDVSSFSLKTMNQFSKIALIKSCSCKKNGEVVQINKHYNNPQYIFSCISFVNELDKDIPFDVISFFKTLLNKYSNLLCECSGLKEANRILRTYVDGRFSSENDLEIIYSVLNFRLKSEYSVNLDYSEFVDFVSKSLSLNYDFICDFINEKKHKNLEEKYGMSYSKLNGIFEEFIESLARYARKDGVTYLSNRTYKFIKVNSTIVNLMKLRQLSNALKGSINKRIVNNCIPEYSCDVIRYGLESIDAWRSDVLYRREILRETQFAKNDVLKSLSSLKTCLQRYSNMLQDLPQMLSMLGDDLRSKLIVEMRLNSKSLHEINKCLIQKDLLPTTAFEIDIIYKSVYEKYLNKNGSRIKKKEL